MMGLLSCRNITKGAQELPRPVADGIARLEGSVISRIEYYYLPESTLTRTAIEPASLLLNAPYKAVVRVVPRDRLVAVAQMLSENTYAPTLDKGDIRLGVIFYNELGEPSLSIYFDQSGKRAVINDSVFLVTGDLRDTLRRPIRCLVE